MSMSRAAISWWATLPDMYTGTLAMRPAMSVWQWPQMARCTLWLALQHLLEALEPVRAAHVDKLDARFEWRVVQGEDGGRGGFWQFANQPVQVCRRPVPAVRCRRRGC